MAESYRTKAATKKAVLFLTDPSLPKLEEALIRKVLEETEWNLKHAARMLEIARGTLYRKIEKYRIKRPF